jgi:HEPN domain-containing protein
VEKAMKGVFVHHAVPFPKTHDLQDLVELLQAHGIAWPFAVDEVEPLTSYAIHTRYPGGFAEVRRQEVDQAIAVAEKVLDWARQQIIPSHTGSI